MAVDATIEPTSAPAVAAGPKKPKLHGRAFYESLGSPKYIVAPMVDQSEFAWRMLSRSFHPESERASLLAYSPMFHARQFLESQKYRDQHFQATRPGSNTPWLDGNPALDRPLFVQFCANDPEVLLSAAKIVAPYCDAVDLNLGCPQNIAKKGRYGSFLQEDQELIHRMIRILHENLDVPVTAKIRILDTPEATLKYAKNVLSAGASILTVHGRRREQKGHLTGLADWQMIRYLRDNLPPETVLFANGNILQHEDLQRCLAATGADGVMSAEGNLSNPGIFAPPPPPGSEPRGYWRGRDGKGGWRVDEVFRRYLDIIHEHVPAAGPAPARRPLFVPGDDTAWMHEPIEGLPAVNEKGKRIGKPTKRRSDLAKESPDRLAPNFVGMQPHLFHLLRHLVSRHHDVRDALGRTYLGEMEAYEAICSLVEKKVAEGLLEYERTGGKSVEEGGIDGPPPPPPVPAAGEEMDEDDDLESSVRVVRECWRPWWVVQPVIRPLPKEALARGAVQISKKDKKRMAAELEAEEEKSAKRAREEDGEGGEALGGEAAAAAITTA
ncbi:hypothetical protein VTJ49DRAFT_1757 [Mycothermus thermophilus]|uniref:tRNA-dihydrouridine(16/17) synthase [NAD(P)(+)] n=1 Tax=Humicola insolens TaxID=85995 RepID=A0ABR3VP45_HUMIN